MDEESFTAFCAHGESETVETIEFAEFDPGTRLVKADGSLWLTLPLMPPSWCAADEVFEAFEDTLERALGAEVLCLDKELFAVPQPLPSTVAQLRAFLLSLRAEHGEAEGLSP